MYQKRKEMVMLYEILSLVFLAAAIAIGCIFKKNTGIVSIALALVLARIAGVSDSWVVKSFNSSLFIMLLGVMYLFCIAQNNRTLELIARRAIVLCRGRVNLIPVVLFVFSAVISAIGPGLISTTALVAALAIALAIETGVEPIKFVLFASLGAFAGGLSPITPSGIVAISVAKENDITGIEFPIALLMFIAMLICAVILYFFVCKWHTHKEIVESSPAKDDAKFELKNIVTILGILSFARNLIYHTTMLHINIITAILGRNRWRQIESYICNELFMTERNLVTIVYLKVILQCLVVVQHTILAIAAHRNIVVDTKSHRVELSRQHNNTITLDTPFAIFTLYRSH